MNSFLRPLKTCPGWYERLPVPASLPLDRAFNRLRGELRFGQRGPEKHR